MPINWELLENVGTQVSIVIFSAQCTIEFYIYYEMYVLWLQALNVCSFTGLSLNTAKLTVHFIILCDIV